MRCPYCQHHDSKVLDTSHDSHGGIRRRRECFKCGQRFSTYERPILATPLLIKQDGTREAFDREKLARGVRISCAKRPVSAADIERMLGTSEYPRLRIGIDPPPTPVQGRDYVLGKFSPEQRKKIDPAVDRAVSSIVAWMESGITAAMNRFNAEDMDVTE